MFGLIGEIVAIILGIGVLYGFLLHELPYELATIVLLVSINTSVNARKNGVSNDK